MGEKADIPYQPHETLPAKSLDPIAVAIAAWGGFLADHPDAINTTVGVMKNPRTRKTLRPESVQRGVDLAGVRIKEQDDYDYQTQAGNVDLVEVTKEIIFGPYSDVNIVGFQSLGGTGALKMTRDTLVQLLRRDEGAPTLVLDAGWPNHPAIFTHEDAFEIETYPHVDWENGVYNHQGCMDALEQAPEHSVALFQVSGYNGDGLGRTHQQWEDVLDLAAAKGHIVIMDAAYLGLTESMHEDAWPIRRAARPHGPVTFVALSNSKNGGLYRERVGQLLVMNIDCLNTPTQQAQDKNLPSTVLRLVRSNYSSPPAHYAEGMANTLKEAFEVEKLKRTGKDEPTSRPATLFEELDEARGMLADNRQTLDEIAGEYAPTIGRGDGMFTTLTPDGFTAEQQHALAEDGIFALPNSRLNISGIHPDDIERVGRAVVKAMKLKTRQ